jgi:hypothetical protein
MVRLANYIFLLASFAGLAKAIDYGAAGLVAWVMWVAVCSQVVLICLAWYCDKKGLKYASQDGKAFPIAAHHNEQAAQRRAAKRRAAHAGQFVPNGKRPNQQLPTRR